MKRNSLFILLFLFIGCASLPSTIAQNKIDNILQSGDIQSNDIKIVRRAALEIAEIAQKGIADAEAKRNKAEKDYESERKYADIGKKIVACGVSAVILIFVYLFFRFVFPVMKKL